MICKLINYICLRNRVCSKLVLASKCLFIKCQNEYLIRLVFKTKLNQNKLSYLLQQYHNRIRDDYISLKRTYPNSIRIKRILKTSQHQFLIFHSSGVTTHAHLTDAHTALTVHSPFYTHPLSFYKIKLSL